MNRSPNRFYEFASFRVDAAERQLWRNGERVPLTAKAFDILLALVENSGRTIEKEELIQRVWADTFVEEGNLNRNVSTLRKILGDDSRKQRFIKTIPKQGYRFTGEVNEMTGGDASFFVESNTRYQLNISEEIKETSGFFHSQIFRIAVAACFLIIFAGLVSAWLWTQPSAGRNSSLAAGSDDSDTFELYKKGRALWQTRNGENLHEATLLLEQAVQKDPYFAPARAALADAYAFDYRHWQKTESVAQDAIRLDPNLGEPHAAIGFVKMFWEWKFSEAEAEFKHAIRLSPNYATGHHWYAINLATAGNAGNAALVEMRRALELDPSSVSINSDYCQALYFLHRFDEAVVQCRAALAMDEKFNNAHLYLYEIYNAKEMYAEAVETYFKLEEIAAMPARPETQQKLREAFNSGGIQKFWEARIEVLKSGEPLHYRIAQHYARLGEKDEALKHLKEAYEKHDFEFYLFLSDPVFDEYRSEARYKTLKNSLVMSETK